MRLLEICTPSTVKAPLDATDKKGAVRELVDLLASAGAISDAERLMSAVWEREQQRSTGIGEGLAIPHGKCDTVTELAMAIGRPAEPIDFNAIDMRPVKLIVLLASPPDRTADHIQALGKISRLMSNAEFRDQTYRAETSEALYELFRSADA